MVHRHHHRPSTHVYLPRHAEGAMVLLVLGVVGLALFSFSAVQELDKIAEQLEL